MTLDLISSAVNFVPGILCLFFCMNSYNLGHSDINSPNADSNRGQYITEKQRAIFRRVLAPSLFAKLHSCLFCKVRLPECPSCRSPYVPRLWAASQFRWRYLQKYYFRNSWLTPSLVDVLWWSIVFFTVRASAVSLSWFLWGNCKKASLTYQQGIKSIAQM